MKIVRSLRPRAAALAVASLIVSALTASADNGIYRKFGLDLGYAGRTDNWAIFTYGGGTSSSPFTALDISSPVATNGQVFGNVALAGAYSRISVSGYGSLTGDRYEQTTSTEGTMDRGTMTGTRQSSLSINTLLNGGITSLRNVSIAAAGLTATANSPTTINFCGNTQIFDNTAFSGKYVMNLTNFVLDAGSVVTFNGVAGSAFVINVSNNFNIGGGSMVKLTGGLTPSDILFYVKGNNAGTTGALPFEIGGNSKFSGTLLAYNSASGGAQRKFTLSGHTTTFDGELITNSATIGSGALLKKRDKGSN